MQVIPTRQTGQNDTVHRRLKEVTEGVEQASASLRGGYRADQLYALRVGVRRIRSLLKPIGSTRSRRFRKTWRGFAVVTSPSRDWDVFLASAASLLEPDQYGVFEARNRGRVERCHQSVCAMLESKHWRRHLRDWGVYLQRCRDDGERRPREHPKLCGALRQARSTLATALESGDERSWHGFRIAVKEVRYQAESNAASAANGPSPGAIVEDCKVLQTLLGGWHDCVVQLHMLETLEPAPEHDALREIIEQLRGQQLAEIQAAVAGHMLFAPPGKSSSSERSRSLSGS